MMSRKYIVTTVLIICAATFAAVMILLPKPTASTETSASEKMTDVRTLEVRPVVLKDWVDLPASVQPSVLVEVPVEVSGRVDWRGPKEGDLIAKAGTPILRIDQRTFKAHLDEAQAAYDLASNNCKRIEQLHAEGIISKEQLDQCRTAVATAASRLDIARIQFDKATVKAPIAGTLNKWYVEAGEYVNEGSHVAYMVVVDPVKVLVKAPEKDVPHLRVGQKVQVAFQFLKGSLLEGTITYVSIVGDNATRTYDVEITAPNPMREILPAMIGTVRILRGEIPDAVTVPLFSVVPRGDSTVVFVEKDGKAHERTVDLGILEGDRVQIVKGLQPGEKLIVEGHRELDEGAPVRVQGSVEAAL
ncbi:efflux RND transporter periplasmic adaptor subunit [Candidatus Poribacteria bacterium]|nr:efflux RND transporter periplasmic adaptor subunit [Candidatus Poribacteria bacterium]